MLATSLHLNEDQKKHSRAKSPEENSAKGDASNLEGRWQERGKKGEEKPKGKVGIAHTRWATHGEPSETNAHPHSSKGRVFIVHNGIIENYIELKEELYSEGYSFSSQTDSELIAHILDYYLAKGQNMIDAMFSLKQKLNGAYAIAVIDALLALVVHTNFTICAIEVIDAFMTTPGQ